ncbi:hypothetical protein Mp_6g01170 [Marchantia polymorpha subsp. ruderalis]|uniref:Uncharacterized protein n=2 Tax=Marchantia polymorpha TaxID=3197 RepID=A0AAF6BMB0_MARPO|nr:hypothetical protein MARPO_0052s0088 [Marchantia polymorpha]BBN13144.1 hypothetical protein Mp_6g01170 [Marchantia polymorpha subsp. ruderalis]|eukprot:PTQ38305.1 hypothetical protein MARPO_0052s0088 [Marchantia polymorpha]
MAQPFTLLNVLHLGLDRQDLDGYVDSKLKYDNRQWIKVVLGDFLLTPSNSSVCSLICANIVNSFRAYFTKQKINRTGLSPEF